MQYVRDCLEVLRTGAGLDGGNRMRQNISEQWRYIYTETATESAVQRKNYVPDPAPVTVAQVDPLDNIAGLPKPKIDSQWEEPLRLRPPLTHIPVASLPEPCDEENPRLFHIFWAGPFTDKPYMAALSFIFTQNVGLHKDAGSQKDVCRPKFWIWINPGPAAAVPNPSALRDMYDELKSNPWSAPLLHPRFKDVIQFKMWNTTEQLDGVPELKDEWRHAQTLLNSGGYVFKAPVEKHKSKPLDVESSTDINNTTETEANNAATTGEEDIYHRLGSKSSDSYDKLSVVLSDMVRFVLCHRFGGIYLDADTLFLRDWEELWGWKGAFAYRWSRLLKYNTAVLRLHRQSALGSFLFRTALKNGLDFHPMTVSRYTKDAYLEGLLLRLPDALFDPGWLNVEDFQLDRPAQPQLHS